MYKRYNELSSDEKDIAYQVMEIQNREHKADVIKKNAILCIDVYAKWCEPCKLLEPAYASLARSYVGVCAFTKENVDLNLCTDYDVKVVPTFLLFYRGRFADKLEGGDLNDLETRIRNLSNTYEGTSTNPVNGPSSKPSNNDFNQARYHKYS